MKKTYLILGGLSLAVALPVSAGPLVFNFNSIVLDTTKTNDGLVGGAPSLSIQNYMNGVCGGCVSSVSGALATSNYGADGAGYTFPSGPRMGQYMTLGTTDGATGFADTAAADPVTKPPQQDVFIMNDNLGVYTTSDSFTIDFTGLTLQSVSFDWEIFADANCQMCGMASPYFPTLELYANGSLIPTATFDATVDPGGFDTQGLGVSGPIALPAGTTSLTFGDWPAEIGIDNLTLTYTCTSAGCLAKNSAPEPSQLPLTGVALALLALVRWKAGRGPAPTLLS